MTPNDIALPFSVPKKEDEAPQAQRPPVPQRQLSAIGADELDKLCEVKKVVTVNGLKIVGSSTDYPDVSDIPLKVCCRCNRWVLSKDSDRVAYGDLIARSITPGGGIEVTWEERVVEDCGLVVYLTYLEYVRVADEKIS